MLQEYIFNEGELIAEIKEYIDATYSQHYGGTKTQSTQLAIERGNGKGFFLGNADKYLARYGDKGSPEDWRKDLMKVIHYSILALHQHDLSHEKTG